MAIRIPQGRRGGYLPVTDLSIDHTQWTITNYQSDLATSILLNLRTYLEHSIEQTQEKEEGEEIRPEAIDS